MSGSVQSGATECGIQFGPDGGGVQSDGQRAAMKSQESSACTEFSGDEALPEFDGSIELFGGLSNHFFKPREEDIPESGDGAGFGVLFVGEERLEGIDFEPVTLHLKVDGPGRFGWCGGLGAGSRGLLGHGDRPCMDFGLRVVILLTESKSENQFVEEFFLEVRVVADDVPAFRFGLGGEIIGLEGEAVSTEA
jgi:hypothetical protein